MNVQLSADLYLEKGGNGSPEIIGRSSAMVKEDTVFGIGSYFLKPGISKTDLSVSNINLTYLHKYPWCNINLPKLDTPSPHTHTLCKTYSLV